ncbi:MAG: Peptidase M15 [Syntrophorhabdus sp. PtaU1.Bin153]|nr:MAG: Peptidase M15 [Syntrophorhabdus sp. PtaU1.Bin153]
MSAIWVILVCLFLELVGSILLHDFSPAMGAEVSRFFLMGDGKLHVRSSLNGCETSANILNSDGSFNEEGLTAIDEVFGFPTKEKEEHISPRLLFMLDYFSDRVAPGKVIHLDSGYRAPAYNKKLKESGGNVARTSTHIDGMAIDFFIEGMDGKALWEVIRRENCCGVGHYGGKDVHLDSGRPRFWEAATSKVGTGESDFNRRIYLSTEYDRYKAGERIRLSLSSVSHFGFGIAKQVKIKSEGTPKGGVTTIDLRGEGGEGECILIGERKASRFLHATLPRDLPSGRYRACLEFCHVPFAHMPREVVSNTLEVVGFEVRQEEGNR